MRSIIIVAHDIRSCHNVGSLLRTAEGLGIDEVILSGYTPYPLIEDGDSRLPHIAAKLHRQIQKTALGAETTMRWSHQESIADVLKALRKEGYSVVAVEQSVDSIQLPDFHPPQKIALILGREVEGIEPEILAEADITLEIPMFGQKESFNVVQAAAIAMYHCRFMS
jgi:23S rRNA (guanosine2251-2'-O)-methyltransferase